MNKIVGFCLIACFLFSCVERIDLDLDETYTRLVVDGAISTDTAARSVSLTTTASYFYNQPAPVVSGATVFIRDGEFTYHMTESDPLRPGVYIADSEFRAVTGRTYNLSIHLAEPVNNKMDYSASSYTMKVARLDSVSFEFQPDWGKSGFWLIKIYAQEPADEVNYYLLRYYCNGILKTDSIFKYAVSDDRYFNGSYINGMAAFYIDNDRTWETLHPGDTVTVEMSGITREYYDFILQVQIAGFNIPFFTGPPANVQGNIDNGAIGFFAAYSTAWGKGIVK